MLAESSTTMASDTMSNSNGSSDQAVVDPTSFDQLNHNLTNAERVVTGFGLVNANKQIRAELWPYSMRHAKIQVPFQNLELFLEKFYGPGDEGSRPLNVEVMVKGTLGGMYVRFYSSKLLHQGFV
jgi:hypothetical protein